MLITYFAIVLFWFWLITLTVCDHDNCEPPEWFLCSKFDHCISAKLRCDHIPDCPYGEDELDCEDSASLNWDVICGDHQWQCEDKSMCILDTFLCDGHEDCFDGSDEKAGCTHVRESCKGFLCHNMECLESKEWVCDGKNDCGDNSDEVHCNGRCTLDLYMFQCKDNGSCIPFNRVCDNRKDCHDGSDEGGKCGSETLCQAQKCPSDKCQMLPSGAFCICPKGYFYDENLRSCQDINECELYGICSQLCVNEPGSYRCTCTKDYEMRSDNKTCVLKATDWDDPVLYFSTIDSIMGYNIRKSREFTVLDKQNELVSISTDVKHLYWTDVENKNEKISRSNLDGSDKEIVVDSGIRMPEGIAVDWWTKNFYFTDKLYQHIAACSSDGRFCTHLLTKNLHKPRGIAVYPDEAKVFWSDWGHKPHIGVMGMDGSDPTVLVSEDLKWPNMIALDYPGRRLYWVDAMFPRIESISFSGKDRHVIPQELIRHPFGISIFEDKLYWSDWNYGILYSCNKLDGKDHKIIMQGRQIRGVHVHSSSIYCEKEIHPCTSNPCSHLCLLSPKGSFVCACPNGETLSNNKKDCLISTISPKLAIGMKKSILFLDLQTNDRFTLSKTYNLNVTASRIDFNSISGELIIADNELKVILGVNLNNHTKTQIISKDIGKVSSMAFDYLGNNLYWADSSKTTVEVYSFQTKQRAIVQYFQHSDRPLSIALFPEMGQMFVSLNRNSPQIIRLSMTGKGTSYHILKESTSSPIGLANEKENHTLYYSMGSSVWYMDTTAKNDTQILTQLDQSVNTMALLGNNLFWTHSGRDVLYWVNVNNFSHQKHINLTTSSGYDGSLMIPLAVVGPATLYSHPCTIKNGGCSHVCIPMGEKSHVCLCPPGMVFKTSGNDNCIEEVDCEFKCTSGECLSQGRVCNGFSDCSDGSDEKKCSEHESYLSCSYDKFKCNDNSQCLSLNQKCDQHEDCKDGSDEMNCDKFNFTSRCHNHQHLCENGRCIDLTGLCDGYNDCGDNSDEIICNEDKSACGSDMFKCTSGQCVDKNWVCDGFLDCKDGSDEHSICKTIRNLDEVTEHCGTGYFECSNGFCIIVNLKCNGFNDCGDMADEEDCDPKQETAETSCLTGEYHCSSNGSICLPLTSVCNGTTECPEGDDERECSKCNKNEFECDNSKCILEDFVCDNEDDCGDGSDEKNCHFPIQKKTDDKHKNLFCTDEKFHCDTDECIEMEGVCDGVSDCSNGADETKGCETSCANSTCDHSCQKSPHGDICSCRPGFRLWTDRRSCVDLNECVESEPCSQKCENTHGSFQCSCFPNFMLRHDKRTCKAMGPSKYMLFATHDEVRQLTLHPAAMTVFWLANVTKINCLAMDISRDILYVADEENAVLAQVDRGNRKVQFLTNAGRPNKLAVDWISGNIYFSENYGDSLPSIKACNFEKKSCAKLKEFKKGDFIKTILVDSSNRFLFFNIEHPFLFRTTSRLYKSNLDATNVVTLKDPSPKTEIFTFDPNKKRLYFYDPEDRVIRSISYDGNQERLILKKDQMMIINPIGMDFFEDNLMMTGAGHMGLVICTTFGSIKGCITQKMSVANAKELLIIQKTKQMEEVNVCEGNSCSVLCVPAETGPKCLCHSGRQVRPSEKCSSKDISYSALNNIIFSAVVDKSVKSTGQCASLLPIWIFIVIMIIIAGILNIMFWKRKHIRSYLSWKNTASIISRWNDTTRTSSLLITYKRDSITIE